MKIACGRYEVPLIKSIGESTINQIVSKIHDTTLGPIPRFSNQWYEKRDIIRQSVEDVGYEWCTSRGTWPKRLFKKLKHQGIILSNNLLSECGKIAKQDVIANRFILYIRKDSDWHHNGDYYDRGSCFFSSSREFAPQMIFDNGGYAILLHDENDYPYGRCWAMKKWHCGEEVLVLFNAYGANGTETYTFARALQLVFDIPYYRKISLYNKEEDDGYVYINSAMGFVLGNQGVADIDDLDLDIDDTCQECGDCLDDHTVSLNGTYYCSRCVSECSECQEQYINNGDGCDSEYCHSCYSKEDECAGCGFDFRIREMKELDGNFYCEDCYDDMHKCISCSTSLENKESFYTTEGDVCGSCYTRLVRPCSHCGTLHLIRELRECSLEWISGIPWFHKAIYICDNKSCEMTAAQNHLELLYMDEYHQGELFSKVA